MEINFPLWEKVKTHVKEHKMAYSNAATAVGVTIITLAIVRGRYAGVQRVPDGSVKTTIRPLAFLSKQNNNTSVVTVIEREGRGHPGYLIRNLDTNDVYNSQSDAAKQLNVTASVVSGHITGKLPDVNGQHLERIAIVPEVA